MISDHPNNISQLASRLVAGPATAQRIFSLPGTSYGDLYTLSRRLKATMNASVATSRTSPPICLCTVDRTLAAATLLATLEGGPSLVMPHAYSKAVLSQLHRLTAFELAVVDADYPLPPGTRPLKISRLDPESPIPAPQPPIDPDRPWVHLFTGGSTGTPQLWTKTVRNLLGEAGYLIKAFSISSDDRILTTSPPYHIYGLLYSVLVPLLANAGIIRATPSFPGEMITAIEENQATVLVTVPALYRAIRNHLPHKTRLRMAFSSASPLFASDAETFTRKTGVPIYDVYGSTETGGIAVQCLAAGETGHTPFACVDLRIKNERLWVRSSFLSPQLPLNQHGYFEMADRVAACESGRFTLLGRTDGVIKVGGKRVDLEEVKTTLLKIAGIRDVLVFSRPTETGRGNEILALLETDLQVDRISRTISINLAPYARPRIIRAIEKMPVTAAGKYDRKRILKLF